MHDIKITNKNQNIIFSTINKYQKQLYKMRYCMKKPKSSKSLKQGQPDIDNNILNHLQIFVKLYYSQ